MGYCNTNDQGRSANPGFGRRVGFGFGRRGAGRNWRHRFNTTGITRWAPPTPEQEAADLKTQADLLKTQLDAIQKRIEELTDK
jgi:hypothetical protein